jgi:hypothetical protein
MSKKLEFSVADGFALLSTRIELPLVEYTAIASKQAEIETYLAQYISTFTTVLPGAFSRRTLVSPLAGCTINMYVLFKQEHSTTFTPRQLLDKLWVTLKNRYENSSLSTNQNAIILPFKDFEFRLQPGFLTNANSYLVPAQGWVDYNSLGYKEKLTKANSLLKGRLIPLIRMVKSWNHVNGNYFDDYYLELLVKDVMTDYSFTSYPLALCQVFRAGLLETAYKKQDPANLEFEVEGLRDIEDLVKAMLHFKTAYKIARYAVEFEAAGDTEQAIENWRKLLPGRFPSDIDLVVGQIKTLGIKGTDALKLMQDAYSKQ